LGPENYIDIIDQEIKEFSALTTASKLDGLFIGTLLLDGLLQTFPCTPGK